MPETPSPQPDRRSISFDDPDATSPLFQAGAEGDASGPPPAPVLPASGPVDLPTTPWHEPDSEGPPASDGPVALPEVSFDGSSGGAGADQDEPPLPAVRRPDFTARRLPPRKPTLRERIWLPTFGQVFLVAVVAVGGFVWRNWDRAVEPTDAHRALTLQAQELADFLRTEVWIEGFQDGFPVHSAGEQLEVRKRLDGSLRVHYRYAPGGAGQPEILVTTRVERSAVGAADTFRWMELGTQSAWRDYSGGSVVMLELDDDMRWGDESRASLVEVDGRPAGHSFTGRMDKRVVEVTLRRLAFPDSRDLRRALDPLLRRVAAYR